MKTAARNNIRLGIFVSASLFLLIAGIYFIGSRQQLFSKTFAISGKFNDISGLQVGNNIRLAGITIGVVEEITQITDSSVSVEMLINEDSRKFIKKDAKALIGNDGLMGNKIIIIVPGTASKKIIQDNDIIATALPVNIDDIMLNLKTLSENSADITGNLAAVTRNVSEGKGTIGMLFMDTVFAADLAIAIQNIKEGAGGFKQNMDAASKSFLLKGAKKKDK